MPILLYERTGGIAILRLNQPEKLNALSHELIARLTEKLKHLEADEALRVLILTGVGDRAFCSGTDIGELADLNEAQALEVSVRGQELCEQIEHFPVPVIAAVNGVAAGGGCELVLACHLRIASSQATFSLPETKLGLLPGYGGTQRLPREVGLGRALEIMLTGKTVTAESAMECGLLNRLVPQADLLQEAVSFAHEIEQLSPLAIRACLKAVTGGLELPLEEGLALERQLFASLFATEDVREGISAFLEKRSPLFKGK